LSKSCANFFLMRILQLFFLYFSLSPLFGFSQIPLEPVKWEMKYEAVSDIEGELVLTATMDDKWHIYSQLQSGDGPIPTSFSFLITSEWEPIGKVTEPEPENVYTEVFQSQVLMFSKSVSFRQKVKRKSAAEFYVLGELEFMSCNDVSCLPPKKIKLNIKVPTQKHGVRLTEVKE
jgi:hypothetical protein